MAASDHLFALLAAADEIPSRTMLQKLVYLSANQAGEELPFAAHFYGPYSSNLQDELEELVAAGLVRETTIHLDPWEPTPFDVVQYRYRLTDTGREMAAAVPEDTRRVADRVVGAAHRAHAWNQGSLSIAAKLHHLRRINPEVGDDAIPDLAKQFGWKITEQAARRGARLLDDLEVRP